MNNNDYERSRLLLPDYTNMALQEGFVNLSFMNMDHKHVEKVINLF